MSIPTHHQQLRQHVAEVKHEASQRYLGSYLFRYAGKIEQSVMLYHDAVHIEVYSNKVHTILVSAMLSTDSANDWSYTYA